MSKQITSIDWLIEQFKNKGYIGLQDELQAKAMHKEETCQFAVDWFQDCPIGGDVNSTEDAQNYYKKKFA